MTERTVSLDDRKGKTRFAATHIVDALRKSGGGTTYSVPALAVALEPWLDVRIRTLEADAPRSWFSDRGVDLQVHPRDAGILEDPVRASSALCTGLEKDAASGSILHVHGLWLMANVYPARVRRRAGTGAVVIHSPRGMLGREALRISRFKKTAFWLAMQRSALGGADCLHATATSEYEEIRAAGLRQPVAVIPNGIDPLPVSGPAASSGEARTVLSLGRIHPKKGLDRLIHAWARLEADFPGWRLRIVGPAEIGHDQQLRSLSRSLGLTGVSIEGPCYEADKIAAYHAADLFVLPTLNENFGLAVAEALSAEVPVISTRGAPWSGLETEGCGWWIDQGVESLVSTLRSAMSLPTEQLRLLGRRGREWMIRDFAWTRIASDMFEVYRWLKTGGPPPGTVMLD